MSDTFIVEKMDLLFKCLKNGCPKFDSYKSVEKFVIFMLFGSIIFFIFSPFFTRINIWFKFAFLIIPLFFIYDVVIYQINVLLFDYRRVTKEKKLYSVKGYTRLFILLGFNYFILIFSFATIYHVCQFNFSIYSILQYPIISHVNTLDGAFYYSTVTMATLGHGDIIPVTVLGRILTSIHTLIGLFINLILIARFVSIMPRPWTKDKIEEDYMESILKKENELINR